MNIIIPEIKLSVSFDKNIKKSELYSIKNSHDAAKVFRQIMSADTIDWIEEVVLLFLSRNSKVIGFYKLATGGTTGCVIDPKVIFTVALNTPGTEGIMIAHNHPSGNIQPSTPDIEITTRLKEAATLMGMRLIDHIIIADDGHYSFQENNYLQ